MTEERDPLDTAADEAAEILSSRKATGASWPALIDELRKAAEAANRRLGLSQRLQAAFAADGGQLPLIADAVLETKRPRAKRRQLMHEITTTQGAQFRCPKCTSLAPIPEGISDAARKRGIPCPKCNATQKAEGVE